MNILIERPYKYYDDLTPVEKDIMDTGLRLGFFAGLLFGIVIIIFFIGLGEILG